MTPNQPITAQAMTPNARIIKRAGPAGQNCSNCLFCHRWQAPRWNPTAKLLIVSECRRFPPSHLPGEDCGADYPATGPGEWCGEWRDVK